MDLMETPFSPAQSFGVLCTITVLENPTQGQQLIVSAGLNPGFVKKRKFRTALFESGLISAWRLKRIVLRLFIFKISNTGWELYGNPGNPQRIAAAIPASGLDWSETIPMV